MLPSADGIGRAGNRKAGIGRAGIGRAGIGRAGLAGSKIGDGSPVEDGMGKF